MRHLQVVSHRQCVCRGVQFLGVDLPSHRACVFLVLVEIAKVSCLLAVSISTAHNFCSAPHNTIGYPALALLSISPLKTATQYNYNRQLSYCKWNSFCVFGHLQFTLLFSLCCGLSLCFNFWKFLFTREANLWFATKVAIVPSSLIGL